MNNKILIGSIIAVVILLLMPSIPAIQQKIVKDEIKDKIFSEFPEDLDFKDIKALIDIGKLDGLKHPLLFLLYCTSMLFRHIRIIFLNKYSDEHPILSIRWLILNVTTIIWFTFWHFLDINFHWNWRDYYPNFIWEYFPFDPW